MDSILRSRPLFCLLVIGMLALPTGCSPRTIVKKNPLPDDTGVRFYRPKPYLLVTPSYTENSSRGTPAGRSSQFVDLQLQYLPDFSEEYSINFRPGVGINQTQVSLADGWNLVALNSASESGVASLASGSADLVRAVGSVVKANGTSSPNASQKIATVSATNVPIGFYQAVVGVSCGRKALVGWQYVGFHPFGADCVQSCSTGVQGDPRVFGLTFRNGAMAFVPIEEMGYGQISDLPPMEATGESPNENTLPPENGNVHKGRDVEIAPKSQGSTEKSDKDPKGKVKKEQFPHIKNLWKQRKKPTKKKNNLIWNLQPPRILSGRILSTNWAKSYQEVPEQLAGPKEKSQEPPTPDQGILELEENGALFGDTELSDLTWRWPTIGR